jgi:hypothetical protein
MTLQLILDPGYNSCGSIKTLPFKVGDHISATAVGVAPAGTWADGQTKPVGKITGIVQITTDGAAQIPNGNWVRLMINTAGAGFPEPEVDLAPGTLRFTKTEFGGAHTPVTVANMPTYKLKNVELCLTKIVPPPSYTQSMVRSMKERGVITYDFLSYQNYMHSVLLQDRQATLMLPLQNSRAKSIICVPTDASTRAYQPKDYMNSRKPEFFNGVIDNLTEYQFVYGGKLNPDRPVVVKNINNGKTDQVPLIETEKALVMAGIKPLSFTKFQNNFVIARALALNDNVYDTRNQDFQLNLRYQESTVPTKNKLFNCFVAHIRGLKFSSSGIEVVY